MDLHKEIKNAYQNIRVSEAMTERLKMELYQKDFRDVQDFQEFPEENSEIFQVEEVPRMPVLKYCSVIAACLAVCIGIGFSVSDLLTERASDRLNPAQSVNITGSGSESGMEFARERAVPTPEVTEFTEEESTEVVAQATARRYGSE
ncbi:MAG: hypothetical protein K2H29_08750 [Oscillospiraceae bacterium]|nr:hypothetical protein [Oscillospiraceae bacterium]MDE5885144.1 hypothetical protein [Oscillospiraceae bacterium]